MPSITEHFNTKWTPEPFSGCWLWTQRTRVSKNGYAAFHYHKHTDYAHRASWKIHFGEIPEGKYVLHKCDTPSCVNPAHLFIGTQRDNREDCIAKGRGRGPWWERNPSTKLTPDKVREIRASNLSHRKLARIYGVGSTAIANIKAHDTWKHVQ